MVIFRETNFRNSRVFLGFGGGFLMIFGASETLSQGIEFPVPTHPALFLQDTSLCGTPILKATTPYKMMTRQTTQRSSEHFDVDAYQPHQVLRTLRCRQHNVLLQVVPRMATQESGSPA